MTIREKGYTHWDGEFQDKKIFWWPITRFGIKLTFKKKFFKFVFFMTLVPAVAYLAGIYISERLEDFRFMVRESAPLLQVNPAFFKSYFTSEFLLFMIVIIMLFCGAGLISDDLKYNSLQLYFSRPITKKDYFIGKSAVIVFFLSILTLIPGIIFIVMKLIFSGSFKFLASYPWLPFSVIGYSVFLTCFFAFYTLFLSSLNKNRRYVSILIFGLYFFSDVLFGIFFSIFGKQYFALLSIKANLQQVGACLFGQKTPYHVSWFYSLLIITGMCVLAGYVLKKKVKGVEIIK